jgi:ABC-type transport system substrate-binding protein
MTLMKLAAKMWAEIGVRATIEVMDEATFMHKRKQGMLSCYTATWTADFDDPDNFIYTFFGNRENTKFRSLCYHREDVMERVRAARAITDPEARLKEYHDLEEIIVQRDAAWIPLFSRLRYYVISERLHGVHATWNGSIKNNYRYMSVD